MALMRNNGSGITLADMKLQKGSRTPLPWKRTMQNYVITWHAWLANPVAFLVVLMRSNVPYAYLSSVSTADNFTNNVFPITTLMLWIS